MVRFCLELKSKHKVQSIALWHFIEQYQPNLIDLGDKIYVTGVAPYSSFSKILEACLAFGVVECEIGSENQR